MIVQVVSLIFQIYILMLIVRVLSSWVPELQATQFIRFIAFYTDPYLNLFRKIIPPLGMIDISPIFAFLALELLRYFLLGLLR